MATIRLTFGERWKQQTKLAAQFAVGVMAHVAKEKCAELISADDHSPKDLAAMGHPYAARDPHNPHDPPETVHTQTGALLAGLQETAPVGDRDGVSASVHNTEEELDGWIQRGTSRMIARPYMERVRDRDGSEILLSGKTEMVRRIAEERSA